MWSVFRPVYATGLLVVSLQLFLWLVWESVLLALAAVVALVIAARRTPAGNRFLGLSRRQRYTGRPPRALESPMRWLGGRPRADAPGPLAQPSEPTLVTDGGRRRVVWPDGRTVTLDDPPQSTP